MDDTISSARKPADERTAEAARADIPFGVYKRQQARISRHRLYPVTVFYTAYVAVVLVLAMRSRHPWVALAFFAAGVPVWTLVEYLFHRYVLHGRFAPGKGIIRRFLHERLDPLHWEHHKRPFDGHHINGEIKDLLPLFFVAAPVSLIAPLYTLPMLLAGTVESYVLEEWIHHSCHYYNFRNPYFRYIKRYHFYHHSPKGENEGFGLTNGFWDIIFNTRYPRTIRQKLYSLRPAGKRALQPASSGSATPGQRLGA